MTFAQRLNDVTFQLHPGGGAGRTRKFAQVPPNITLISLPAKSPELNPTENIWQFMREKWLSNRIFTSYRDILDHCCFAWNKLVAQPWTITSIGMREWAHRS